MPSSRRLPTPSEVAKDFDRLADLAGTTSDHNSRYYPLMLSCLPRGLRRVLDVGCGAGELARLLAPRAQNVEGIDLAPRMIARARQTTPNMQFPNVTYSCADLLQADLPGGAYDAILSAAALHHVPLPDALSICHRALRPGGVLVVLDLYEADTVADHLTCLAAAACDFAGKRLGRCRTVAGRNEAALWAEHGSRESYPTLAQVTKAAQQVFTSFGLRRLLYYRYLLVCTKAG